MVSLGSAVSMPSSKVLFATKCWSGDWAKMLAGGFDDKWKTIGYPFDDKVLILNNGVPEGVEGFRAKQTGNVYADGEKGAIEAAKGYDYLCFVQGDCITQGGDWVTTGIDYLEHWPSISVVSPRSEVNTWDDKKGLDRYMSDQAWLVRVSEFSNQDIYQYPGVDPDYPDYAPNSFEHQVGRYLKSTNRYRKILDGFWTVHGV